jgi:hypothetical protein
MNDGQHAGQRRYGWIWWAVGGVFLCGVLVGIAVTQGYHHYKRQHRGEQSLARMKPRVLNHLTHQLRLTDEQVRAIEPLVSHAETELLQLRMAQQPRVEEIVATTTAAINATLSPEQQHKLDELSRTLQQRWDKDRDYVRQLQPGTHP